MLHLWIHAPLMKNGGLFLDIHINGILVNPILVIWSQWVRVIVVQLRTIQKIVMNLVYDVYIDCQLQAPLLLVGCEFTSNFSGTYSTVCHYTFYTAHLQEGSWNAPHPLLFWLPQFSPCLLIFLLVLLRRISKKYVCIKYLQPADGVPDWELLPGGKLMVWTTEEECIVDE